MPSPKSIKKELKLQTFTVEAMNFATNKWEILKLIVDPRKKKERLVEGLAVYSTRYEAEFCRDIALAICGGQMSLRIKKGWLI